MAGEEDVELRDLVAQSLEAKGVLGKIRVSFTRRGRFGRGRCKVQSMGRALVQHISAMCDIRICRVVFTR